MGHISGDEPEDRILSSDSPLSNDGDNFFRGSDRGVILKKGPWTTAEDAILIDYVKKHGEGNWNSVQKHTGLSRCGKSCRLRWANHLRPNLKKGAFTPEEERLIIELHAKMGNKWARMAVHLPGRTDNEIKNYWNTRIKRRQRAGLPLYPTEFFQQALPEKQQNRNSPGIFGGDEGCHDSLPTNGYEAPDVMFDSLNMFPYRPDFPDIFASGSLMSGFGSPQFFSFLPQTVGLHKLTQELNEQMNFGGNAVNDAYPFDMVQNDRCENKMSQSCGPCFSSDPNHTKQLWPFGISPDSFMSNDIFSASEPLEGAEKLELPSLQYQETNSGVWDLLPFDAAPEFLDSFIQSPLSGTQPSHCSSPRSSGLLEALLYEAKFLSKSENQSSDKATSSTISQEAITYCSSLKAHSAEIKGIDPTSPSGNSTGSTFNRCIPADPICTAMEEKMHASLVKSVFNQSCILDEDRKENLSLLNCSKPDAILGSCWLEQSGSGVMQHGSITDAIFLGDDLGSESKKTSSGTSGWGITSCTWNNMPSAYQMSDLQ